jgi:hypothetical protein
MNINKNIIIGDYIYINDKYIGIINKIIWNSNGYIVKLINNQNYEDKTLKQYKIIELQDLRGYMLITLNDKIKKIDFNDIENIIKLIKSKNIFDNNENNNIINKINFKYNNFIKNINRKSTKIINN